MGKRAIRPKEMGARIRAARNALGLTQNELAANAGITQGSLSRIEGGHTQNPEIGTILNIATGLGTSPYILVFDHYDPPGMGHAIAALVHVWDLLTAPQRLQVVAYAQGLVDSNPPDKGRKPAPRPSPDSH